MTTPPTLVAILQNECEKLERKIKKQSAQMNATQLTLATIRESIKDLTDAK